MSPSQAPTSPWSLSLLNVRQPLGSPMQCELQMACAFSLIIRSFTARYRRAELMISGRVGSTILRAWLIQYCSASNCSIVGNRSLGLLGRAVVSRELAMLPAHGLIKTLGA